MNPLGYSAKYDWARKWNIPIVTVAWVTDSLKSNRLLDTSEYLPSFPDTDEIPFSLTDLSQSAPKYLKDCKIVLSESKKKNESEVQRFGVLRRLILIAGGVRLSSYESSECTHWVLVDQLIESDILKAVKEALVQSPELYVVHDKWLVDCYKAGKRLNEEHYKYNFQTQQATRSDPLDASQASTAAPFRIPPQRVSNSQKELHSSAGKLLPINFKKSVGKKLSDILYSNDITENSSNNLPYSVTLPLTGCTVAVSTRLWHKRAEYHSLVSELGGTFAYSLDRYCTHLIHSATTRSDALRDIADARSFSVKIVSPTWLESCKNLRQRVSEDQFPFFGSSANKESLSISQLNLFTIPTQSTLPGSPTGPLHERVPNTETDEILLGSTQKTERYFCFTGLSEADKKRASKIILDLKGEFAPIEKPHWDTRTTHLITGRPSRSEKYLAAMASGSWILTMDYLDECERKGSWDSVDEEKYEVGRDSDPKSADLATAAHKWRLYLSRSGETLTRKGAFTGWRVLLVCGDDAKRRDGFVRLLEAGGAAVFTPDDPILPDPITTTHLLLSSLSLRSKLKNDWLVHFDESRIHTTEYIAEYLQNPPNV